MRDIDALRFRCKGDGFQKALRRRGGPVTFGHPEEDTDGVPHLVGDGLNAAPSA